MPHRGNPNQPSRGPTLDTRAGPRPTRHSRTFQDTSTQEGRMKPPTRTHSLKERARRRCTDAHARPHPPRRHGRVHIGTPQFTAPAFQDTSTRKAAASVRLTCPLGGGGVKSGNTAPTPPPADPDHPRSRNLQTVHPIHTRRHPPQTDSQTPQGHQTQTHPHNPPKRNTSHATSPRSVETTSTSLPCRTGHTPPQDCPFRSWAATQQPNLVTPPLENSPPTHTAACRNGPPASPPRTFSLRTFSDERHTTGARVGVDMP